MDFGRFKLDWWHLSIFRLNWIYVCITYIHDISVKFCLCGSSQTDWYSTVLNLSYTWRFLWVYAMGETSSCPYVGYGQFIMITIHLMLVEWFIIIPHARQLQYWLMSIIHLRLLLSFAVIDISPSLSDNTSLIYIIDAVSYTHLTLPTKRIV